MSALNALDQYVTAHTERGMCRCGRCVDADPSGEQPNGHTADMVFFEVSQHDADASELRGLIEAARHGEFADLDPLDGQEHSYLEVGAWLGDQGLALTLMGLGELLGLWRVMTPKSMGFPEDYAMQMASAGMVSIMPPAAKPD